MGSRDRRASVRDVQPELTGSVLAPIRPQGEPTAEQLRVINEEHALEPLKASDVYVFSLEISNDLLDSYSSRMDPETTLPNYAQDFQEGRSLQNSHNTRELPLGRSFEGRLENRGEPGDASNPPRTAAVAGFYLQRGIKLGSVHNDDVIRGIAGGTIKDASVQFVGGNEICSECGLDYGDGDDRHTATSKIIDAHAIEGSLVFDGATPLAMIDKARALLAAGQLSEKQVRSIEEHTGVRIRGGRKPGTSVDAGESGDGATAEPARTPPDVPASPDPTPGAVMTPRDFADLICSRMPQESKTHVAEMVIAQLGDACDNAYVEEVTRAVLITPRKAERQGDVDSIVQEALDAMANGGESTGALMTIINASGTFATPEDDDEDQEPQGGADPTAGIDDDVTIGDLNPETQPNYEDPLGLLGRAVEDRRKGLLTLRSVLHDLADEDADGQRREQWESILRAPELAGLREYVARIRDGRRYRAALMGEIHEWGTRARGDRYNRELYERLVTGADVEQLERLVGDLETEAFERFANAEPGQVPDWARRSLAHRIGRQTVVGPPPGGPPVTVASVPLAPGVNADAYRSRQLARRR